MISSGSDEWSQREVFRSELMDRESIQWVGQPDPSVVFSKADRFLVPFSLLWGGFAIFWTAAAAGLLGNDANGEGLSWSFVLFGIPFVLIGLYFIFGRFYYKAWKKRRTYYAVTDKRVLALVSGRDRNVQAIFIRDIPIINKFNGSRGTGTVVFGNADWQSTIYANTGMEWMGAYYGTSALAFYDIKDADAVHELVNRLRNQQQEA